MTYVYVPSQSQDVTLKALTFARKVFPNQWHCLTITSEKVNSPLIASSS